MIVGFLPPISSESLRKSGADTRAISAPVRVLPVNETAETNGCETKAAPASPPRPCKILRTPGGNPQSLAKRESRDAVTGVISDGLATTQLPEARAGAIFQLSR